MRSAIKITSKISFLHNFQEIQVCKVLPLKQQKKECFPKIPAFRFQNSNKSGESGEIQGNPGKSGEIRGIRENPGNIYYIRKGMRKGRQISEKLIIPKDQRELENNL